MSTSTAIRRLPNPRRGEVWLVELDPVRGSEQAKTRPAVVMSMPGQTRATVRVCEPIISANAANRQLLQCAPLAPNENNGLSKESVTDAGQVRTLDLLRFEKRLGVLTADDVHRIAATVALVVGYTPVQGTSVE